MADLTIALARTLAFEGGYVNDPHDRGGETYRGISRTRHPDWPGWSLVDQYKSKPNFPKSLELITPLQSHIAAFYQTEFWEKLRGSEIGSQAIANELFDCAVNMGVPSAVRILQEALNLLAAQDDAPLVVDGRFGPATFAFLSNYFIVSASEKVNALLATMLLLRAHNYAEILAVNPAQRTFAAGWFSRLFGYPELQRRSISSNAPASN